MQIDYKNILKDEIDKKESKTREKIQYILDGIYEVFFYILKEPLDNIWWECISLVIQYLQLIIFTIDELVSNYFIKNIVFRHLDK